MPSPAPGGEAARVLVSVYESKAADGAGTQSWAAAPPALGAKALADFVFGSRSWAATKFSRSMAVTTPNTICFRLDFP